MQESKISKLLIAAIVAGSFSSMQAASADESVEFRRTTVINGNNAETTTVETRSVTVEPGVPVVPAVPVPMVPAVVTTTTTAVPLTLGDSALILQTVDSRRTDILRRIDEARAAGTLSTEQLANLTREMDRINAEVVFLRGQTTPSLARSLSLAKDLDALALQVHGYSSNIVFVPIIEGSHFTIFNGRIVLLDDLAVRRIGLENKILDRLAQGKISFPQANELRADLNAISAAEDASRTDGDLSPKESRVIYTAFDKVANRLDDYSGER